MRETCGAKPPQGLVLGLVTAALIGAAATAAGDDPPPPPMPAKQPVAAAPPTPPRSEGPVQTPVHGDPSGAVGLVADPQKPTQQELAAGGVVIPGVPAAPPTPPRSEGPVQTPVHGDPSGAVGTVPAVAMPRTAAELAAAGVKAN